MRFQLLLHITHIISRAIYFSWVIFLAIGLLDIRTFAETSVNKTKEINSIIKNLSNNETLKNESSLIIPTTEKLLRMPHKLEYYSIKRDIPQQKLNSNNSQNRSFETEVLPLKNPSKINFSTKPALKNSGWLFNDKSPAQGKREAYERMRKSATSEQNDAHAYKDYYNQQQQQQQQQQEQPKPVYVDGYNTIPPNTYIDDYRDYGNIAEEQEIQKGQNSYYSSGGVSSSYGCSCYKQASTRQANGNCDSPASTFLTTLGMLGASLWQLIQIMATSAIPFVIPILALKLILVPIKIFKFLQLIKFFFKLFIVLPFLFRVFYPAISNGFGLQNFFYSKPHPDHHYDHSKSREESNATGNWHSNLEEYILHYGNISGDTHLRACSSKAACELGSFLSTSTKTKFPEKLAQYLVKKAEGAEEAEKSKKKDDSLESEKESAIRTFIIALGRKWSMEQCAVYNCSVML